MDAERPELESMTASEVAGTAVGIDGTILVVLTNGRVFAGISSEVRESFAKETFPEVPGDEIEEATDHFWSEAPPVPGTRAGLKADRDGA